MKIAVKNWVVKVLYRFCYTIGGKAVLAANPLNKVFHIDKGSNYCLSYFSVYMYNNIYVTEL